MPYAHLADGHTTTRTPGADAARLRVLLAIHGDFDSSAEFADLEAGLAGDPVVSGEQAWTPNPSSHATAR